MSDLLLDGAVLDAASEGDWVLVGSVGFLILVGMGLGLVSWLKGRKIPAVFVWTLIGVGAAILLLPLSTIQDLVGISESNLVGFLVGLIVAALLIGLFSAIRLARPPSWWAQRRYDNDRYAEAIARHQWTRPQAR